MKKMNVSLLLAMAAVFSMVGAALAAKVVINTNNGIWDSGWGTVFRVDSSGDSTGPAGADILEFYVNVNPAEDEYYFGAILDSEPPLDLFYVVDIDCDDDLIRNEADDAIVYGVNSSAIGSSAGSGPGDATTWILNSGDGEVVSINRFEWRSQSFPRYPQDTCFDGNRSFRLRSCDDYNCPTVYDETAVRYLDLPTAITLRSIAPNKNSGFFLAAASLLLAAASSFIVWRKRYPPT